MSDLTAAQLIPLLTAFRSADLPAPAELSDLPSGMLEGLDFAAVLLQQLGVGADELPSADTLASLIDGQSEAIDAMAGQADEVAASPDASALLQNLTALFQTIASSAAAIDGMAPAEDATAGMAVAAGSAAQNMLPGAAPAAPGTMTAKEAGILPAGGGRSDSPVPQPEIRSGLLPAAPPPVSMNASDSADNGGASARRQPAVFAVADVLSAKTAGKTPERETAASGIIADREMPTYADATNSNHSASTPTGVQSETAQSLPSRIDATPAAGNVNAAPVSMSSGNAPGTEASFKVDTPAGARGWDADFSQKLVWMVHREESRAELILNPPQLGKVEVTISVNGDQTSASFVSASPAAREVLEQALPRLREILADAGITLGQASVNAESTPREKGENPANAHRDGRDRNALAATGAGASADRVRRGSGLIDTFA